MKHFSFEINYDLEWCLHFFVPINHSNNLLTLKHSQSSTLLTLYLTGRQLVVQIFVSFRDACKCWLNFMLAERMLQEFVKVKVYTPEIIVGNVAPTLKLQEVNGSQLCIQQSIMLTSVAF